MITLLLLPFRVLSIFTGFDFKNIEDYGPIFTLIIGVLGAVGLRYVPQRKAGVPLLALMFLLSIWPLLPSVPLLFMASEFQRVYGAWPQVMVHDPKTAVEQVSPAFDALFHLTSYLEAFSGAWLIVFIALLTVARSRFSLRQNRLFLTLTAIALIIAVIDPGALYAWWLD